MAYIAGSLPFLLVLFRPPQYQYPYRLASPELGIYSPLILKCPPRIQNVVLLEEFVLLAIFGFGINLSDSDDPGRKRYVQQWVAEQIMSGAGWMKGVRCPKPSWLMMVLRCLIFILSKDGLVKAF